MGFFKGLKNDFKIAVVNEPSVFEPVKFYCICMSDAHNINLDPTTRLCSKTGLLVDRFQFDGSISHLFVYPAMNRSPSNIFSLLALNLIYPKKIQYRKNCKRTF